MSTHTGSLKKSGASFRADWLDLPTELRFPLIAVALVDISAKIAMWFSLARRPSGRVRGPKALWAAVSLINGFGPASYWLFGRK
ncbi:hypothetical protein [Corynebacterium pacaense]|uniref:hypothetical protein n=1 Tax=Corynebacterium pacaense TaxID=1816684 RepID=UPI0015C41F88|nr:hypothetical protein [Corynebacterium pacaense]